MDNVRVEPVIVFATQDEALVVVAESILHDAGIKYVITNRLFQDLVGDGRLGVNIAAGTVCMVVLPDDAEAAKELLRDIQSPGGSSLRMSRLLRLLIAWLLLGPMIIGIIQAIYHHIAPLLH